MSIDKKAIALVIIANGIEKIIPMDKVKTLTLTFENGSFDLEYTEKTKQTILTNTLALTADAGTKIYPEDRKSAKGIKHGPVLLMDIDEETLVKIYKEYREAVPNMQGIQVAKKWSEITGVKHNTLTVWMSQIKQLLEDKPTSYIPQKLYKVAGLLS